MSARGTSNGNACGNAEDRRRRRAWLVDVFGWRLADGTGVVCCYRCGVPLLEHDDPAAPGQSVTADRILPGVLGGRYVRGNLRPACGPCNSETGGELVGLGTVHGGHGGGHGRSRALTAPDERAGQELSRGLTAS